MTSIFHITHISNLPKIIDEKGLWSENEKDRRGLSPIIIGYVELKDRRKKVMVPVGKKGVLSDYVPFYFAPRSPMLYCINTGTVNGYSEGQDPVLHLVSYAEDVRANSLDFVFTEGHPVINYSDFFEDLADLNEINWAVMKKRYWSNQDEDKRQRQAEFLVYRFFPWSLINSIGVISTKMAGRVERLLDKKLIHPPSHRPDVLIKGRWYY